METPMENSESQVGIGSRYVCPHCKTNDEIFEINLNWVEYRGQFNNDTGHIDMFDTEEGNITDSADEPYTHYRCGNCNKEFNEPLDRLG